MRKTIILGALAALLGLAAVAQANDQPQSGMQDGTQVTRQAAHDSRDAKHDRDARNERSRHHENEANENRNEAHEGHDADEGAERKNRR